MKQLEVEVGEKGSGDKAQMGKGIVGVTSFNANLA